MAKMFAELNVGKMIVNEEISVPAREFLLEYGVRICSLVLYEGTSFRDVVNEAVLIRFLWISTEKLKTQTICCYLT